jgi:tRNA 5-methylaminomethyl-2-thiouridine biosynthesis bifunctional protein
MPRLDAGDTVEAGLLIDAYLAARDLYRGIPEAEVTDVLQTPRNAVEASRFEKLLADPSLPLEDLEAVRGGGLLHKRALILRPPGLIARLLAGANCHFGGPVQASLETCSVNGETFDAIILANGMSAARLAPHLGTAKVAADNPGSTLGSAFDPIGAGVAVGDDGH